MDKIRLKGLAFFGFHGCLPEERKLGQRFFVDLELRMDLEAAGHTDNLENTVNYAKVYDLVKGIVEGPPKKLIEAVAEAIASDLVRTFPGLEGVKVVVRKPEVPIPGILDHVEVEVYRGK